MWNSTFKPKASTPMKRTPLSRGTSQMQNSGFKPMSTERRKEYFKDQMVKKQIAALQTPNSKPRRGLKRGSMQSPIPTKMRAEMALDPFYSVCVITGKTAEEAGEKIEWHHNLIYNKERVNRKFCILPLLQSVHERIVQHKEKVDWIMWNRATEEEIAEFSKAEDYKKTKDRLNLKFN